MKSAGACRNKQSCLRYFWPFLPKKKTFSVSYAVIPGLVFHRNCKKSSVWAVPGPGPINIKAPAHRNGQMRKKIVAVLLFFIALHSEAIKMAIWAVLGPGPIKINAPAHRNGQMCKK